MGKLDEILKDITFKPGEQTPAVKEGENEPTAKVEEPAKAPTPDKVEGVKDENVQEIDFSKIPEDKILGYLAGKVGKEVKTWDDLVEVREVEKEVEKPVDYASPDVANIDKFVRETGRGVDDYFKVQKDWDNEPNEKVVKEYLKTQYPSLDKEDIEVMYEDYFQTEEVTEDMLDDEKKAIDRKNRSKLVSLKTKAEEARKYFNSQKEQYKTPLKRVEENLDKGKEEWVRGAKGALSSLDKIEIDGFSYEIRDKSRYDKVFDGIDSLLGTFKNEDGTFNYGNLVRVITAGMELPKILEEHAKAVKANTVEEEMRKKSNATQDVSKLGEVKGASEEEFRRFLKDNNFIR